MRILRLKDVMAMTGLGRSTIYKLQQEGRFPKGIKLSERAVGWLIQEVEAYVQERLDARNVLSDPRSAPALAGERWSSVAG